MDCKTLRKSFDPSVEIEDWVNDHLLGCDACQSYVSELSHLRQLLASSPPVPVPRNFDMRLQRRLERLRRDPLQWWRFVDLRYALPVAAMMVVAATLILVNRLSDHTISVSGRSPTELKAPAAGLRSSLADGTASGQPQSGESGGPANPASQPSEWEMAAMPESGVTLGHQRIKTNKADGFMGYNSAQVILRVRDESNQEERLVTIPSVVFGAQAVLTSMRPTQSEMENVY